LIFAVYKKYKTKNVASTSQQSKSDQIQLRLCDQVWDIVLDDDDDDDVASRDCMKMALRQCASAGHADDSKSIFLSVLIFQKGFFTNGIILLTD